MRTHKHNVCWPKFKDLVAVKTIANYVVHNAVLHVTEKKCNKTQADVTRSYMLNSLVTVYI